MYSSLFCPRLPLFFHLLVPWPCSCCVPVSFYHQIRRGITIIVVVVIFFGNRFSKHATPNRDIDRDNTLLLTEEVWHEAAFQGGVDQKRSVPLTFGKQGVVAGTTKRHFLCERRAEVC